MANTTSNQPGTPTKDPYMKKLDLVFEIVITSLMVILTLILMLWNVIKNDTVEFVCLGVFLGLIAIGSIIYVVLRHQHKVKLNESENNIFDIDHKPTKKEKKSDDSKRN